MLGAYTALQGCEPAQVGGVVLLRHPAVTKRENIRGDEPRSDERAHGTLWLPPFITARRITRKREDSDVPTGVPRTPPHKSFQPLFRRNDYLPL
ncbi:hypothetical protein BV20DRAFT_959541, partial [Pilatotrama ljubarskyi]